MHFKDLMMDFFRGQTVETMEIDGLQHVISISAGEQTHDPSSTKEDLPNILLRVYLIGSRKVAGSKVPRIELEEMGPRMDLKLGRWQEPNEEMMSMALKKPKPATVLPSMCRANCRLKRRRMLRLIRWEINLVVFILVCRI